MRATVSCQNTAIHWPRLDAVVVMVADPLRITLGRHILQAGETAENAPVTNMACFSGEVKTLTGREEVWLERGTQNIPGLAKSFISPFGQIFPHFPAKAPQIFPQCNGRGTLLDFDKGPTAGSAAAGVLEISAGKLSRTGS